MNQDTTLDPQQLLNRIQQLEAVINMIVRADRFVFRRPIKGDTNGLQILSNAKEKLGFYGAAPLARPTNGIGRSDVGVDAGGTAHVGTTYTGNTGSSAYSVGDLVNALKTYGLLT